MFKKENVQFYVGAAVGVTVGLCVGKLLSPNIKYNNVENVQNDNLSANNNEHNCRARSRSASECINDNQKDSTFLMTPLIKPALSNSDININSAMPVKKMQWNKSPIYKPCQIMNKKENLLQDRNANLFNESCNNNKEEKITMHDVILCKHENIIQNNLILKSESFDIEKNIPGCASLEYSSDNFDQTNMGICNTIVDVKQVDLPSTPNNCEFVDIEQYDEFNGHNLLSSTQYDISIQF